MFPSVPPLKMVASFSLSVVQAGLLLSQLATNQVGGQKDDQAGAAPPPPSASADAKETEAVPDKKVPPRTDDEFPTKTPKRAPPRRARVERVDHMDLDARAAASREALVYGAGTPRTVEFGRRAVRQDEGNLHSALVPLQRHHEQVS